MVVNLCLLEQISMINRDKEKLLKEATNDLVYNLLYFDRKDDELLNIIDIEELFHNNTDLMDELSEIFHNRLHEYCLKTFYEED